jgi:hypothetical protein
MRLMCAWLAGSVTKFRWLGLALLAAGVLAGAAVAGTAPLSSVGPLAKAPAPGPLGPEGVPVPKGPVFANVQNVKLGESIDGVKCELAEKVAFHIHAHLTIFVNGKAQQIPYGIGIGQPVQGVNTRSGPFATKGTCFMWLHTHALDGIVHVEAPKQMSFTLGQFFAVWGLKLSTSRVGPVTGKVTTFYNGKVWTGSPAGVPLSPNAEIQLDLGKPLFAPEHIKFPASLGSTMTK